MRKPPWKLAERRITVEGTRGKTGLALLLHREIVSRGGSSFCKTTGAIPVLCMKDEMKVLERKGPTRLYENLLDIKPKDYCIMENQGVSPYTMRVFNEIFVKPQMIVVTNVRLDHVEEMGRTKEMIARSFASTFGEAQVVFSGETDERLNDILRKRARKLIEVEPAHPQLPGAEIPALLNTILEFLGLGRVDVRAYLEEMKRRLKWEEINEIVYFDASKVNDPDSAAMMIRWLGGDPFLFIQLRRDRPGRTWAFLKMVKERWVDFSGVAVAGEWSHEFSKRVKGVHLPDSCEGADILLKEVRNRGRPLFITGNRKGNLVGCLLSKLGIGDGAPTLVGKVGMGDISLS